MKPVRVAVIGTGGIAGAHLDAYSKVAEAEVVAVCDIIPEKAENAAKRWNVPKWFTDYRKVLQLPEVEAVDICTPHAIHAPIAFAALKAGKHVLVEKPMTSNLKDAVKIVKAAKENGKVLFCGIKSRWAPSTQQVKKFIESGALGEIYYAEIVATRRRGIPGWGSTFIRKETAGGGVVLDLGVYLVDTLLYFLNFAKPLTCSAIVGGFIGKQPEAVVQGGWWWNPEEFEVDDFGAAFLRFENGAAAVIKVCWAAHIDSLGTSFLLGTKGGLKLSNPPEWFFDHKGYMVQTKLPQVGDSDGFVQEVQFFVQAIRDEAPPPVRPEEALTVQAVLEAIYKSAELRREVLVTIPPV
ncbi:MAG: Gfo/Idh/MocA family protein [Armatimonadota bacterium]